MKWKINLFLLESCVTMNFLSAHAISCQNLYFYISFCSTRIIWQNLVKLQNLAPPLKRLQSVRAPRGRGMIWSFIAIGRRKFNSTEGTGDITKRLLNWYVNRQCIMESKIKVDLAVLYKNVPFLLTFATFQSSSS